MSEVPNDLPNWGGSFWKHLSHVEPELLYDWNSQADWWYLRSKTKN